MIDRMLSGGVIAVVRLPDSVGAAPLRSAAAALAAGGVDVVEVTLTTPGALEAIAELASDEGLKGCMIGAGTVLDVKAARDVIARGARFVVSPTFDRFVVRYCNDHHVPCLPGALTPRRARFPCPGTLRAAAAVLSGSSGPRVALQAVDRPALAVEGAAEKQPLARGHNAVRPGAALHLVDARKPQR